LINQAVLKRGLGLEARERGLPLLHGCHRMIPHGFKIRRVDADQFLSSAHALVV